MKTSYFKMYCLESRLDEKGLKRLSELVKEFSESLNGKNIEIKNAIIDHMTRYAGELNSLFTSNDWTKRDSFLGRWRKSLEKCEERYWQLRKKFYIDDRHARQFRPMIKEKHYWHRIDAHTYAAIVSRDLNLYTRKHDFARGVSSKEIDKNLDKICDGAMTMLAVNYIDTVMYKRAHIVSDEAKAAIRSRMKFVSDLEQMANADWPTFASKDGYNEIDPAYAYDSTLWTLIMLAFKAYMVVVDADGSEVDTAHDCLESMIKVLSELPYDAPDSLKISAMSKIIDMVHTRGRIASAFVEGGVETCNRVSNMSADEIMESADADYIKHIARTFMQYIK